MSLTKEEVQHIAKLARIELSEEEINKFQGQLSSILEYIDQLQEVSTDQLPTHYSWDNWSDFYREDIAKDCTKEDQENILKQAPSQEGGYIKVKSVF